MLNTLNHFNSCTIVSMCGFTKISLAILMVNLNSMDMNYSSFKANNYMLAEEKFEYPSMKIRFFTMTNFNYSSFSYLADQCSKLIYVHPPSLLHY